MLAKVPGLKVSARTSAFHFKGKDTPIPEIAKQLGVAYVVEGSVRKAGNRVRITAQLIKAADGFHVWSDNFDRELKDIFAVQDEIAGLIAGNLSLKLGVVAATAKALANPEVYRLYLEARQAWNLRNPAGYDRAELLLNRALQLDPNFAPAHAALSDVWMVRVLDTADAGSFGARTSSLMAQIIASAERALVIDPNLAEAHASLGSALRHVWRLAEAERACRRAVELNPNYASGRQWLGRLLMQEGRLDEALTELRAAVELDPLSSRIADNYAICLLDAGRFEEALTFTQRALALQPGSKQALVFQALALIELGRTSAGVELGRKILAESPQDYATHFAYLLARAGNGDEARRLLRLEENVPQPVIKAATLAALGDREACLAALKPEQLRAQNVEHLYFWPIFDSVRRDPRFLQVIAAVGMTQQHERAQAWRASFAKATEARAGNQRTEGTK